MIYGRVTEGKATIPVIFRLPLQPDFSVDFVIETGFNGYLTLPPQVVKPKALIALNYIISKLYNE